MSVESATYINQLSASNPTSTDLKSEGDNHIRLLKSTIQASFPNITGAMTATQAELNQVVGVTSPIQTQIDAKLSKSGGTMTGQLTLVGGGTGSHAATVSQVEELIANAGSINLPAVTGHDGDVLSVVGGVPTWVDGGLFLLASYDAAVAATVDIEALSSRYDDYVIEFSNVAPSAASSIAIRVKKSGAYVTGSTYTIITVRNDGTSWSQNAGAGSSAITCGNLAAAKFSGRIVVKRANSTSGQAVRCEYDALTSTAGNVGTSSGYETTAAAIQGIRIYVSSGVFTTGTFRLYGVAK